MYLKKIFEVDPRCWAYYLYNVDLTNFEPCQFPSTEFNRQMKKHELDSPLMWIEEWLQHRVPKEGKESKEDDYDDGPSQESSEHLYKMYRDWYGLHEIQRSSFTNTVCGKSETSF